MTRKSFHFEGVGADYRHDYKEVTVKTVEVDCVHKTIRPSCEQMCLNVNENIPI